MKEIGALLKAAREAKGLSLDEVQMVTKIRYKHLVALEAGDFDQLPGEVYVKGFLGTFAKTVGLDSEEILQKYYTLKNQASSSAEETPTEEGERIWPEPVMAEKGPRPAKGGKPPFYVLVIIGGLLLAGAIFWVLQGRAPATSPVTVSSPAPEAGTAPVSEETLPETPALPGEAGGQAESATTSPTTPTSTQTELPPATPPVLVVEADEVVWMGIYRRASGALLFEGTLYPEERREWILTEDVTLRIGNAGGLRVSYRGQDLGKFGASGQVVTKVITVD